MKLAFRSTAICLAPWIVLAGGLGAWFWAAEKIVPRLIADAYAEQSHPALNRIIKDRTRLLEFYLQEWHQRRKGLFGAALAVAGGWAAGAANLVGWLRRRARHQGRLDAKDLDRALLGLVLAAAAGVFFLLIYPLLTGHVYLYDDLGYLHLPLRSYYARSLAEARLPTWCPELFCGFDAHGEGQGGFWHPGKWGLYKWLPLEAAFNVDTVLAYPAAMAGMWVFLRRRRLGYGPAALGGFTFAWSGYLALRLNHTNVLQILAHLPWALACIDVLLRSSGRRERVGAGAGLAVLTASQLLLGYPPSAWYSGVAELVYAVAIGWGRRLPGKLLLFGGMKLLGILLAGVLVLPTLAAIPLSQRAHLSREGLATDSLIPWNFFQWISPFAFSERTVGPARPWEFAQYAGLLAPAALLWVFVQHGIFRGRSEGLGHFLVRRRDRRVWGWVWTMILLGAVFALGAYGPVFSLLAPWPPFRFFRSWCRYSFWIYVGVSVGVAGVVQALLRRAGRVGPRSEEPPSQPCAGLPLAVHGALGGLVLLAGAGVLLAKLDGRMGFGLPWASTIGLLAGPVGLAIVWGLLTQSAQGKAWAVLLLAGVHLADLAWYDLSYWLTRCRFDRVENFIGSIPLPPEEESLERTSEEKRDWASEHSAVPWFRARLWTEPAQEANVFLLTCRRSAGGWWGGLIPRQSLPYPRPEALRVAGVAWWKKSPFDPSPWQKVPDPLPEIRLVTHAQVSTAPAEDLAQIDPARTALVDRPVHLDAGEPGKALLLERQADRIRVRTQTSGRQLLVVAESFHPGWTAQVDGQTTEILRAYGDFMAVEVGPGVHEVLIHWRPASLRWGLVGSCAGLAGLGLWIGLGRFVFRRMS